MDAFLDLENGPRRGRSRPRTGCVPVGLSNVTAGFRCRGAKGKATYVLRVGVRHGWSLEK